jgi:hypothetical protein
LTTSSSGIRATRSRSSPPELKALHPLGSAPLIADGGPILAESGAIVEYILAKYGEGKLTVAPDQPEFADYLQLVSFRKRHVPARHVALFLFAPPQPAAGQSRPSGGGGQARARLLIRRWTPERRSVLRRTGFHCGGHHVGLLPYDDASLCARRTCPLSGHPRVSSTHRQPGRVPAGDGKGRPRRPADADLRGRINSPCAVAGAVLPRRLSEAVIHTSVGNAHADKRRAQPAKVHMV